MNVDYLQGILSIRPPGRRRSLMVEYTGLKEGMGFPRKQGKGQTWEKRQIGKLVCNLTSWFHTELVELAAHWPILCCFVFSDAWSINTGGSVSRGFPTYLLQPGEWTLLGLDCLCGYSSGCILKGLQCSTTQNPESLSLWHWTPSLLYIQCLVPTFVLDSTQH